MSSNVPRVAGHYTVSDLGDRILDALRIAGKDVTRLTVEDLAPVDAFHLRGRAATAELADWVDLSSNDRVLDVGSGLGGTGRYLASATGCRVTGVDLTQAYCAVATMLSERVGLADRTTFRQGSALDLPFDDGQFDVCWTEHVQMNIADKSTFYAEMRRVLEPGGRLAFHDIFRGDQGEALDFPVPWAMDGSISHLESIGQVDTMLSAIGFSPVRRQDTTAASIEFLRDSLARVDEQGPVPLGLHLLMGDDARLKFRNVLRNLESGRLRVVQAVLERK